MAGASLTTSPGGAVSIPLIGPNTTGGQEYRLSQVDHCVAFSPTVVGEFVNGVAIVSDTLTSGLPLTSVVSSNTDRTANGCYKLDVPQVTVRSYGMLCGFASSPSVTTANAIWISGIRTTWIPAAAALATTGGEAPTETFLAEFQLPIEEP